MEQTDQDIERAIASKLIEDALAAGYTIDVFDGGAFPLTFSKDRDETLAAMFSTDADTLYFYKANADGIRVCVGWSYLVYGNGYHVIADGSGNKENAELHQGADALADLYEQREVA